MTKKPNFGQNIFRKLSPYAISRKTHDPNSRKWQKTSFWVWFTPVGPKFKPPNIFLKNLASSDTRYHSQLSSCTISEKTNDPILRKLSDGRTDESDFTGCCPTNVECPTRSFQGNAILQPLHHKFWIKKGHWPRRRISTCLKRIA